MDSARELSIDFLRTHPEGAAHVLEALPAEDAAAFLADVPHDLAGKVFERMQPLVAAAILPGLSQKKAVAVLLAMDIHDRSQIVRLLDDERAKSVMKQMPKSAARDLDRVLNYPDGSVGAWMSSDLAVFDKSTEVGECLAQLRALPYGARNLIFVVDADKKLRAAADLAKLLSAADDATVERVADPDIRRLSPYAQLSSVVAFTAWDTALSLPVVDTKGRLLGALHFDRLREGLASQQRAGSDRHIGLITFHLVEAFLVCAASVLQTPSAEMALSRPVGEGED